MKIKNAMYLYAPDQNMAVVVEHPSSLDLGGLMYSTGACYSGWDHLSQSEKITQLLIDAWQSVVRDGMSPTVVHGALMSVDEIREVFAEDCQ